MIDSYLIWIISVIILFFIISIIYLSGKRKKKYPSHAGKVYSFDENYKTDKFIASIFLIGDMGALKTGDEPVADLLKAQLKQIGEKGTVIFLGDNVYPHGLPAEDDPERSFAEARLVTQLDMVKEHAGKVFFISGNHDWNKGKRDGWEYVKRQEEFVEKYLNNKDIFLPDNGCPGPIMLPICDQLNFIAINTQWFVQDGERPIGVKDRCLAENEEEFCDLLTKCLKASKGKKVLIAGHHPVYSYSVHGGKFKVRHHLFPLTVIRKKLYVPLPLLGSFYTMYRKYYGTKEDIAHPAYRRIRKKLLKVFAPFKGIIYASGHDHNLQHIKRNGIHYLISGSGSKVSFVRKGRYSYYVDAMPGFFRLNLIDTGEICLEAWVSVKNDHKGYLSYATLLD